MADALANERSNGLRPGRKLSWGISPVTQRAAASREPKKPEPPVAAIKPAPAAAPAIVQLPTIGGRVLAIFSDYDGLWSAMRDRVDEMGITREQVDELSGNPSRYTTKVLGPGQVKKFGKKSLGDTLGALGSYLALVDDPEQVAKLKAVADAVTALAVAVALGITRKEFERIAAFTVQPRKHNSLGLLGDALNSAGCKLALVEDKAATEKMIARTEPRKRPLRPAMRLLNGPAGSINART